MKNKLSDAVNLVLAGVLAVIFLLIGWKLTRRELYPADLPEDTAPPASTTAAPPASTTAPSTTLSTAPSTTSATAPTATEPTAALTEFSPDYFSGSLFIGDSRTVGLMEYGGMDKADFFATTGMSVYNIEKEKVSLPGQGTVRFSQVINAKTYDTIYLMLGINELGYNMSNTVKRYGDLLDLLRQSQPEATLVICANLHVAASRSASDSTFNNPNIDRFNQAIAAYADGQTVRYIDVNPLFDDGSGNLDAKYTSDNTHVLGKYYRLWAQWIAGQGING